MRRRFRRTTSITRGISAGLTGVGLVACASSSAFAVYQNAISPGMVIQDRVHAQLDHNGNEIVLSHSGASTPTLVKIDGQGNTTWSVTMPNPTFSNGQQGTFLDNAAQMIIDANNNVYIGTVFSEPAVAVTKVNANGAVAWGGTGKVYTLGAITNEEHTAPGAMAFGSDGSLYVVTHSGVIGSGPSGNPVTLLRIDPSTGAERNRRSVGSTTDYTSEFDGSALGTDSSGNVYYGAPEGLWSFSQDLSTQRWNRSLAPRALLVDSANSALYVTGVGSGGGLLYNMFVARLSTSTGATAWTFATANESHPHSYPLTVYDNSSPWLDDRLFGGNRILLDSTGQVYAAGYGVDGLYHGGIVVKLDHTTGAMQWLQHYGPTSSNAGVCALGIDNLNDIYISGQETGRNQPNYVLPEAMILSPIDGTILWSVPSLGWGTGLNDNFTTYEIVESVLVDGNGNTFWQQYREYSFSPYSDEDLFHFKGDTISDGTYVITGLNSGMALDDPGLSTAVGTQMDQWTVNNGSNQKWTLSNLGGNTVRLVNQASGLSLGVRSGSTSNGAAVEQNVWTGATSQQWAVSSTGTLGYFTLKNVKSGQLLDVAGASKNTGAAIDQWPSNGGANQKWHLQ